MRNSGFVAVFALLLSPSCVLPQSLDEGEYFVENNTDMKLRCSFRRTSEAWSRYFTLEPGDEFAPPILEWGEKVYFSCTSPVVRKAYRLQIGERYSLLEKVPGRIRLYRIDTDVD
jgi:hypothetical protein